MSSKSFSTLALVAVAALAMVSVTHAAAAEVDADAAVAAGGAAEFGRIGRVWKHYWDTKAVRGDKPVEFNKVRWLIGGWWLVVVVCWLVVVVVGCWLLVAGCLLVVAARLLCMTSNRTPIQHNTNNKQHPTKQHPTNQTNNQLDDRELRGRALRLLVRQVRQLVQVDGVGAVERRHAHLLQRGRPVQQVAKVPEAHPGPHAQDEQGPPVPGQRPRARQDRAGLGGRPREEPLLLRVDPQPEHVPEPEGEAAHEAVAQRGPAPRQRLGRRV